MSSDPFAGARVSALAILSGTCPLGGDDVTPFDALARYMAVTYPEHVPGPGYAGADVHYDAGYGHLVMSAQGICSRYLTTVDMDELSHCAGLIASVMCLQELADRHARRLADEPRRGEVRKMSSHSRALAATTALARLCDVVLAETGDARALARNAIWAEGIADDFPALTAFANGARGLLAINWPGSTFVWYPEVGCLGVHAAARRDGQAILDRAAALQDVDEDRAGIVRRAMPTGRRGPHPGPGPVDERYPGPEHEDDVATDLPTDPGVLVFPTSLLDAAGKSENRTEVKKTLGSALGARLPLVRVPEDWDAWEAGLSARSQWLAAVPRALRAEQGGHEHWDHTVLCVVGPPGAGKTRLVREIAQDSGLHYVRINGEAATDTSVFGTSIRWSTSQAGVIERAMAAAASPTALLHYDELEKSAGSRQSNSGKITDLLHGLWEPETAQTWRSVWLGDPINAGHLVHIVTVNSVDGLPGSLVDRMRVVRVGEPGPEHLPGLAHQVAVEACRELGLDPRWGTLDGEELAALAEAWPGGSVRRLQRLVAGLLRARDGAPGSRH